MSADDSLKSGKISRLLVKYGLPCVASLVISALYNVVDQLFIGNSDIGYLGNTATTIVFPLTILALALSLLIGDGAAAYLSLCQGRNDTKTAGNAIGCSITLCLLVSGVFTAICLIWLDDILKLMGANSVSPPLARTYGLIVVAGVVFSFLTDVLNPIIRSDGAPIFAMVAQGSGAVANIILDPLFIYVFKQGLAGAAYATIIGQAISAMLSIIYLCKSRTFCLKAKFFVSGFGLLKKTLTLGISSFFIQMSLVFVTVASNQVLTKYGNGTVYGTEIPAAVFGIAYKVFTIIINIPIGVALGGLPIIGFNYGAKQFGRVKKTYSLVVLTSLAVTAIACLIFEVFPIQVVSLFGSESDVYNDFAVKCFRIYLCGIVLTGLQRTSSVFFQALGKSIQATVLSLVRDLVILVPLTYGMSSIWGLEGFLWSAPVADVISFILTAILVLNEFKKLGNEERLANVDSQTLALSQSK